MKAPENGTYRYEPGGGRARPRRVAGDEISQHTVDFRPFVT